MANTYCQLYVHIIFAVKYRDASLDKSWRPELFKYITGIISGRGHKVYAVGGVYDHVHLFVSMLPSQSVSELVLEVKRATSLWINEKRMVCGHFAWQEGFSAFSYGMSQVERVVNYIRCQEEHHLKHTFHDENEMFLKLFKVDYNESYLFKELI